MRLLMKPALSLCTLLLPAISVQASTISVPGGSGTSISFFEANTGSTFNRSVGQTFKVPTPTEDNFMHRLSFELLITSETVDFDYAAFIYEFDAGSKMTGGPALFESGPQVANSTGPATTITIDYFPKITLDPAKKYIAFLSTQGQANDNDSRARARQTGNTYSDGDFTVQFNDSFAPTYDTLAWQVGFSGDFAGFEAVFVPEPSAATALLLGFAGLTRRRRR